MKKLSKEQKDLVIKKLEETGEFPDLVQKAKKDPNAEVSDQEWNQARKTVVKRMMRESDSRFFHVAPLLEKHDMQSSRVEWLYNNRENIGFLLIVAGTAMIFLDPNTFAERGEPPFIEGPMDYVSVAFYIFNWGLLGWSGVVLGLAGYLWSRHPKLFID